MEQTERVIEELYANNQSRLRYMCDKEISKFGGVSQKDLDDFYSRVGYELTLAKKRYDPSMGKSFMNYVSGVIKHSIWKEMTDRNRMKRQIIIEKEEEDDGRAFIDEDETEFSTSKRAVLEEQEEKARIYLEESFSLIQQMSENTTKQKLDERIDCLFNKQKMKKESI